MNAEVEAMETAIITPHLRDVLRYASLQTTAIVSNNSAAAIDRFFDLDNLPWPEFAYGRDSTDPSLMKPNPHPLTVTAKFLGVPASRCVLVGDSTSDIEAAQAAGTRSIGYANKDGKAQRFLDARADAGHH